MTPLSALGAFLRAFRIRVRQRWCSHTCWLGDMVDTRKGDEGDVSCLCLRCGKVLRAPYGLALDCTWGPPW